MPQRLKKRWREIRAREKETKHLTIDLLNESKQQSIYIYWEKFIPLKAVSLSYVAFLGVPFLILS